MKLDPTRVPVTLVALLPMAERWGIGDDFDRAQLIDEATLDELKEVVAAVDSVEEADLYGWLSGPEALVLDPSAEYVAVTNLTMVADSARLRIQSEAGH